MGSLLQHTEQAPQIVSAASDNTDTQFHPFEPSSTLHDANIETGHATAEVAIDSGILEAEGYSVAPGTAYEDFTLFPEDDRTDIDVSKYELFADFDVLTQENVVSLEGDVKKDTGVKFEDRIARPPQPTDGKDFSFRSTLPGNVVRGLNGTVYEVLERDYDTYLGPGVGPSASNAEVDTQARAPRPRWVSTYHRHEHLAYMLEEPSHSAKSESQ